jgi:EAL domain-containing protein (putative c-di-GMP-specific phosphodiesterase class I)/GGDEF domain-containing protein
MSRAGFPVQIAGPSGLSRNLGRRRRPGGGAGWLSLRLAIPVILALIPVMLLMRTVVDAQRDAAVAGAREAMDVAAASLEAAERLVLAEAGRTIKMLADRDTVRRGGPSCEAELRSVLSIDRRFVNLGVVSPAGRVWCSALPVPAGTNLSDRDYIQDALRYNGVAVSGYQVGRITGVPSVNIGAPLAGPGGRPVGVVFGAVSLDFLAEQIEIIELPEGARAIIFDRSGVSLVDTRHPERSGDPAYGVSLSVLYQDPERALAVTTDSPVLAGVRQLTGGAAVVAVDRAIVEAPADARAGTAAFVAFGAAILGGVSAMGLSWATVGRPISRIRHAVRQIAGGDLSTRLAPRSTRGTFNALSVDIDEMTATIARSREALERLAREDGETGLPNRVGLLDAIAAAERSGTRTDGYMIYLWVQSLPEIASTFGFETGEEVAREIAARLRRYAGERGGLTVARSSDRSFACFSWHARGSEEAIAVDAEREMAHLLGLLRPPIEAGGVSLTPTVSGGSALYGASVATGTDAPVALRRAEVAARRAAPGEGLSFDERLDEERATNLRLLSALRSGLRNGELHMAYQPIVGLGAPGEPRFEALIRWTAADGTRHSPDRFIPLAEQAGLITEIDRWVLHEVTGQMGRWRADGFDPRVSVNLSAPSLQQPALPEYVRDLCRRAGVSGHRLDAEITETALVDGVAQAREVCAALRAQGLGVSVDDFGMGYSPLQYVHRLPVTAVKVDRSFVRGLGTDPAAEPIVASITTLARRMRLDTVAEGVETAAMRDAAWHLGLDRAQGYLWSPALPAMEAADWFAARH